MTVLNSAYLKVVQAINMPDAVEALNVFYYKADFQEPQDEADVVLAAVERMEEIWGTVELSLSDLLTIGPTTVYNHDGLLNQWDNIGTGDPDITFQNVTEMLPHGVSALVRAYTIRARTVGRKYIPGFCEDNNDDGAWGANALTALGLWAAKWGTNGPVDINNTINPGVWSTVGGAVFELIDEYVVLANPGYQRRRRPGVGS